MEHEQTPLALVFSTSYLPYIGGAEIAIDEITKRLPSLRFLILTARYSRKLPRRESHNNVEILRLGFGTPFDKWLLPVTALWAGHRILTKNQHSILWGVMISQATTAAYLLKRIYITPPLIITLQEGDSETHLTGGKLGLIHYFWKKVLASANGVTAISRHLADRARRYGYTKEVVIIPNGVREDFIEKVITDEEKKLLKKALHINSDEKIILSVSRLVHKNGVDRLIKAFAELKTTCTAVKLVLVGDGPERSRLEELTVKEGVVSDVLFAGVVPHKELVRYYKMADIFARFPYSEGLGSAFLEAMGTGLPIVALHVGGISDIPNLLKMENEVILEMVRGEAGIILSSKDEKGFPKALEFLVKNENVRLRMGANGKNIVKEKYQWSRVSKDMGQFLMKFFV